MSTIMAIGAHPDDIEIGCGAVLARAIDEGHRVICVDLTDGEPTPYGTVEIRQKETARANEILGITERVCLNLPNRVLMDNEESRRRLATVMRKYRPETIIGHLELDAHPDHVAAFHITRGVILLSRIVKIDLEYEPWRPGRVFSFLCSHLRHPYQPSFVVDVAAGYFERKMQAIKAYESQFIKNQANNFVEDYLSTRMKYYGSLARNQYGEGFISQEPVSVKNFLDIC